MLGVRHERMRVFHESRLQGEIGDQPPDNVDVHQKEREKELKAILRGYVSMDASVRNRLQKFGFIINGAGKHYELVYFGDKRYAYTFSKTASDARAGVNAASAIATLVL